jgi:hypothetical protein
MASRSLRCKALGDAAPLIPERRSGANPRRPPVSSAGLGKQFCRQAEKDKCKSAVLSHESRIPEVRIGRHGGMAMSTRWYACIPMNRLRLVVFKMQRSGSGWL